MIFSKNKNEIRAYGTIWSGDGMEFVRQLSYVEQQYDEITLRLHTYGGSVFDGNLICNAIEKSKSKIHIIIEGLAASMGAIIILSATKVSMVNNGYIMIHAPSSGSYGNAKDHESNAKLLRMMENNFKDRLMARTGKASKEIEDWLSTDTWFSADEAKKLGLVTDVIAASVSTVYQDFSPEEIGETEVYNMYACALLTGTEANNQLNIDDNMKQLLITALALEKVNAQSSDTAILEAVQARINEIQNELKNEKTAKTNAENELKKFKDDQITAMIDAASSKGSKAFTDDEKKVYQNIGIGSGIEALALVLKNAGKSESPNIFGKMNKENGSAEGRASWSFDQWQKEDPKGLEKLSVEDSEAFKKLFNAKYK